MPLTQSYPLLVVLSGVFGFVISALPTVTSRLLVDLLGIQHLNSSFGALTFVRGFAALLGPPIAGFALDRLQTVAAPFTLSTIFLASSALIHMGVWFLVRLVNLIVFFFVFFCICICICLKTNNYFLSSKIP